MKKYYSVHLSQISILEKISLHNKKTFQIILNQIFLIKLSLEIFLTINHKII
jgi:hypothetical protein